MVTVFFNPPFLKPLIELSRAPLSPDAGLGVVLAETWGRGGARGGWKGVDGGGRAGGADGGTVG